MLLMAKKKADPEKFPYAGGPWAAKLRALRAKRKWSQRQAAKELGLSQGNLSDLEAGRYLPSGPLKKLIELLSS